MKIGLTLRIWLTVASIVLIFTVLVLGIVPNQQEKYFTKTLNNEVSNLSKTVALGVTIALEKEYFKGINVVLDFAKKDERLEFITIIEIDTVKEGGKVMSIEETLFTAFPPHYNPDSSITPRSELIIKSEPFYSDIMNGIINVGFKKDQIKTEMNNIRFIAIVVSVVVFSIGILLGLWLAKTISKPVVAIRDAAIKVGEGDLSQKVKNKSNDEIGELSKAFNKMVDDLAVAENEIQEKNKALTSTLDDLEIKNEELFDEKKKSDNLLLNILPEKTAEELKKYGHSRPKHFDMVSVMFIDFVKFTHISEQLSPEELVEEIDYCFKNFDKIVIEHGVEKIKTIGDAYLCVGGLPTPDKDHALNCARAALDIRTFLNKRKVERDALNLPCFEGRIGIHSGPLVAGIVGLNKFAYDIWGDTVNTAARMESASSTSKINISASTYNLLKDYTTFSFEARGKIEAKNKGQMDMYFLEI